MKDYLKEIKINKNSDLYKIVSFYQPENSNVIFFKIASKGEVIFELKFLGILQFMFYSDEFSHIYMNTSRCKEFELAIEDAYGFPDYPIPDPIQEKHFQLYNKNLLSLEIISCELLIN